MKEDIKRKALNVVSVSFSSLETIYNLMYEEAMQNKDHKKCAVIMELINEIEY